MKLSLFVLCFQFIIAFTLQAELIFEPGDLTTSVSKWRVGTKRRTEAFQDYKYRGSVVFRVRKAHAPYLDCLILKARQEKGVLVLKDMEAIFYESVEEIKNGFEIRPSPRYLRIDPMNVTYRTDRDHKFSDKKYYVSFNYNEFQVNKEIYQAVIPMINVAKLNDQLMVIDLYGISEGNAKAEYRFSLATKPPKVMETELIEQN